MKTQISEKNPFGTNRYGFLWEVLNREEKGCHLDFGAYDGTVIKKLAETGVIEKGVGVDLNKEVVSLSESGMPENTSLKLIAAGKPLPFDDDTFDSVSILDVIEHIHDQESILKELYRVLKPNGLFIITVPQKHLFSFLDLGNLKFRFPRLHRHYYVKKYGFEAYKHRYVDCANGLFGDIEKEKMWHQHFSPRELGDLLANCGFKVVSFDGAGFFFRPMRALGYALPRSIKGWFRGFVRVDEKAFAKCHLFCLAAK